MPEAPRQNKRNAPVAALVAGNWSVLLFKATY